MADAGKVSLRPRGRFNINEIYERLDFVKYNTGCYVALQTTTGNLPTDTTNFMNLIDFDIANMSQIGLVKPDGESTTIDADGTLHAHAVGSVTSFNGRTDEVLPQTGDYTAAQVAYDNTDSSLSANNVKSGLDELDAGKADTSVIAPVESGTTASRAYAAGAHFIKDGAFCTAKTAIAQGETFTLNTNYTAGTVGQELYKIGEIVNATYPSDRTTRNINTTGGAIVAQLTLTPGKWIMNEGAFISGLTAESSTIHGYVANANTAITSVATLDNANGSEMINLRSTGGAIALSGFIEIAQTTTYYYKIYNGNGGYNSGGCKFRAMRIA